MEGDVMRWQDMPEGKRKYSAYLCSREWSVLKEAVKARSGGICERCLVNPSDHVHHLTYERKYAERLEDLQDCCKQCHEFIHAKSDYDPADERPIVLPWRGEIVKSFYLAGKITGTTWRDEIVSGWSEENHRDAAYCQAFIDYDECLRWAIVPNACAACGVNLHYTGPWWKDTKGLNGGHGSSSKSEHPHGYFLADNSVEEFYQFARLPEHSDIHAARTEVSQAVQSAIEAADLVFAWIDGPDCYGTILEIGYARAMGKAVVVAFSEDFASTKAAHEMWLLTKWGYYLEDKTPKEAWEQFWRLAESESGRDARLAEVRQITQAWKNREVLADVARARNLESEGNHGTKA
jgi:nucleoside 2-deoxyribosyltransferase